MGHIQGSQYCETGDKAITMVTPLLQRMSYRGYVDTVETGSRLAIHLQRVGVDLMVWVSPGRVYCIEVKGRDKHYDDIWVEVIQDGGIGWDKTLRTDYMAYLMIPTGIVHIIEVAPFLAWYNMFGELYKKKRHNKAGGSYSVGVIIPWTHIEAELYSNQYQVFHLDEPGEWDSKLSIMGLLPGGEYQLGCNNQPNMGCNEYHGCRAN